MHHLEADVDRVYIPRYEGGKGMIQLELSYKTWTIGQYKYPTTLTDWCNNQFLYMTKPKKFTL